MRSDLVQSVIGWRDADLMKTTPSGNITTVPGFNGPKLEAEVVFGADWIFFDPDQKFTRMNVRGLAK